MSITPAQIGRWIAAPSENELLDFEEGKQTFSRAKLVKVYSTLANKGSGQLILCAMTQNPRLVVGSLAFGYLAILKHHLLQCHNIRAMAQEFEHQNARVVVLFLVSRPVGMPMHVDSQHMMRGCESLTDMTQEMFQRIFDEAEPNFSANTKGMC